MASANIDRCRILPDPTVHAQAGAAVTGHLTPRYDWSLGKTEGLGVMDESDPTRTPDERQARWREVQTLLLAALDQPPQAREAMLQARAGNDPSLIDEVQSLLAAHDDAATLLDEPSRVLPADPTAVSEGTLVGPFRLLELLGRGGMGVVWLAERAEQDFTQRVAIKLVKRGMDSEEILARFLRERRLLARLDHPNIARLLDGGITDQGLPWFAMEYVDGVPLLAYCDRQGLGVDARLELQRKICEAVEHAHRNLIVHRDLKPSNILVTADGEPKLLDFGIAKVLGASDDEEGAEALVTKSGMRMMTPHYAAPEQVLGEPITTATDVYALGVILYELLTNRRAFEGD
ncbi:MAG: serine/threonine-protein kinase, partial [Pseudomonadota bacterium]